MLEIVHNVLLDGLMPKELLGMKQGTMGGHARGGEKVIHHVLHKD